MPSPLVLSVLIALGVPTLIVVGFLAYVWIKYAPIIGRIFEHPPVFQPPQSPPLVGGEEVRFPTRDGVLLAGTYLKARTATRAGVVVFCPEYLGDRGSAALYADPLRDLGFDLFAFDFRNHGESGSEPGYAPVQWVSNRETRDLKGALAYLRKRPDADPAGVGLFGVSRGGSAAICVAARDPRVWGVVTDGAFGTRTTMISYIHRWAEIYTSHDKFWKFMPLPMYEFAGWAGRMSSQWRLGRRFTSVERAAGNIAPRPLLMIHGANDNYINKDIARALFDCAHEPKELWIVPKAKHNRCRQVDPDGYRGRVGAFFRRYAPRRAALAAAPVADDSEVVAGTGLPSVVEPVAVGSEDVLASSP